MDNEPAKAGDPDEFRLLEIDAQSPDEVIRGGLKTTPLPLPEQDRASMAQQVLQRRRSKLSLRELIFLVTGFGVLLAPIRWMPLAAYALALGVITLLLSLGFLNRIPERYRTPLIAMLLSFYLVIATVLVVRQEF